MRDLETLTTQSLKERDIDVESFWKIREPFLEKQELSTLGYIRGALEDADVEIYAMPDELFDPMGDEASLLKNTHVLLDILVNGPEQDFTLRFAQEIFPVWYGQLQDAREWLGTI